MGDRSKIEWTEASWNPVRARAWAMQDDGSGKERIGWHCSHVSEGCRNCYAETINRRLGTGFAYKPGNLRGRPGYFGGGRDRPEVFLDDRMLTQPLRWKRPRQIFVCSMTDLFGDFVTDEWIDKVFAVMALCPQHTFQVLTKRPERMRDYVQSLGKHWSEDRVSLAVIEMAKAGVVSGKAHFWYEPTGAGWVIPNVWLGTSVEDQKTYDERSRHLRATTAAVHWFSMEPLLGPIVADWLGEWVVAGGESGPGARPMHPDWARSLRDQCAAAGVPFFFKQWGEWLPWEPEHAPCWKAQNGHSEDHHCLFPTNICDDPPGWDCGLSYIAEGEGQAAFQRVGKKAAGRRLDGVAHDGFPVSRAPAEARP